MLSSVAQRLAALHDAGYVHCALNPAKVILMAATRRWAVVGFSRAAPAGTVTPLNFTLAYAAPEAVRAFVRGHRHITADEALDAWALGVMAYEVLTGSLAFNIVTGGQAKVCCVLRAACCRIINLSSSDGGQAAAGGARPPAGPWIASAVREGRFQSWVHALVGCVMSMGRRRVRAIDRCGWTFIARPPVTTRSECIVRGQLSARG